MDARVTKQRLSNMLSYDWIKILVVIAIAVTALSVFFTMVRTRPRAEQVFEIYGYTDLRAGGDASALADRLKESGVFSYDILDVESETFDASSYYGSATYMARRSTGKGKVMFTTVRKTGSGETDMTYLEDAAGTGKDSVALDLSVYLSDCENYLIRFFGTGWETGTLDRDEAERCFLKRNETDKRYRSAAKRAAGIEDEYARLEKLRSDFAFVQKSISDGVLSFLYTAEEDGEVPRAFSLRNLTRIGQLYYYTETTETGETRSNSAELCLFVFDNGEKDAGQPADRMTNDLRYEALSFVRYLVEIYK